MGMYDTVVCKYPLPNGDTGSSFQTKQFDCQLDFYTITEAGRLIHHTREWEATPDDELPYPKWPFFGCMREVAGSQKDVDMNYHGDLWLDDYKIRFTDGTVTGVTETSRTGGRRGGVGG